MFEVGGEVRIEGGFVPGFFGVGFGQSDGLGDRTAAERFGGVKNGKGALAIFDDDFGASAHVSQQRFEAGGGGFLFREMDYVTTHVAIIHRGSC